MNALNDFHFIYPYWFLVVPLVLLIVWWLAKNSAGGQAWQHFIDERLRPFVISGQEQGDGRWLRYSVLFASLLAIIALAGPSWEKRELPAFQTQQGLVLGLDLSSSMLAVDVTPNRLSRARFKLMDLLKIREEGQTGLVVFAGDAFAVAPLTDDRENIIEQVKNLSPNIMPAQGSLVYRGIDESVELLRQAGYAKGDILMIADGVTDLSRTLRSAEAATTAGYRVSIASVGTEQAVPIPLSQTDVYRDQQGQPILVRQDKAALQNIAESGGGIFHSLSLGDDDIERFQQFFQTDNSPLLENNERAVEHWQNEGVWLLWLLLPFGLLFFRKGYLFTVVMAFGMGVTVFIPQNSYAFSWDDLWLNSDQQAHKALLEDKTEQAKALFQSPEWKASAAFRNGDFEESAGLFENQQTADAHYNRGTALAKAEKIEEAIKAYDQALALQADHEDAKFNRDLLEKMKNQQDQQQDQKDKNGEEGQQDQKDQQGEDGQQDQKDQQEDKSQGDQSNDQDSQQQSEQEKQQAQKAAEEQQKKEAEEREKEAQEEKESQEQGDKPEGKAETKELQSEEEKEQDKQTKQWLYQIPDDSSGLWRRKFQYQYRQRQPAPSNGGGQPW